MRIHSLLSPKCQIGPSRISSRGVFAKEPFDERELVAVWGGKVYSAEERRQLGTVFPIAATHSFAVCSGYYLGSENLFELDDAELFNHSCEPNIGVQGQIVVIARRSIAAGEELLIDYGTLDDEPYDFECHCGANDCRKLLRGDMWKDADFRQRHQGFLSWHLESLIQGAAASH